MSKIALSLTTLLLLTYGCDQQAQPKTPVHFYVSPDGSNIDPGTKDKPFATLSRARDAIRLLRATEPDTEIRVLIRGGTYYIDKTIVFDQTDSGSANSPIVYAAYPGEKPVFTGGKEITGWTLDTGNIYKVHLSEVANSSWRFDQIFENGKRATKARTPNTGYFHTETVEGVDNKDTFIYAAGDIPAWQDYSDAQVFIFASWDFRSSTLPISNINTADSVIALADRPGMYAIGSGDRYFVQGIKDELDRPGEFYLDEDTGCLYYWPVSTTIDNPVIAPVVENIFELKGSSPDHMAQNIIFEGLTLCFSKFTKSFDDRGRSDDGMYARPRIENRKALIRMENASNITVKNCKLCNAGFSGVCMDFYCQNNTIYGNTIRDCGYYGVLVAGKNPGKGVVDYADQQIYDNKNHTISNNHIHHCGRLVGNGAGIYLWQSGDNEISHNLIHNMPRYGISVQGASDYVPQIKNSVPQSGLWQLATGRKNIIKFNHVYQVNQDSEDTGAISLRDNGHYCRIENNRIHDMHVKSRKENRGWAHGIYLDDATSFTTVKNNIVYDITGNPKLYDCIMPKGAHNNITNNIFVAEKGSLAAIVHIHGGSKYNYGRLTLAGNIIYVKTNGSSGVLYSFWDGKRNFQNTTIAQSENNLFYLAAGGDYMLEGIPGDDTLANWQKLYGNKYDQHSLLADPLFVDPEHDDYNLKPSSPAFALGFEEIDQKSIGLKADFPQPHSPSPYDGQAGVSIHTKLNWTAPPDADSHDIYFGTDSDRSSAEFRDARQSTTYHPGALSPGTTYYWSVDNDGDVWHFTTESAD